MLGTKFFQPRREQGLGSVACCWSPAWETALLGLVPHASPVTQGDKSGRVPPFRDSTASWEQFRGT